MPDKPSDLVQGTLDMLILKTLALEPMHGYGISVRIEQMSKGVFRLNAGSLFLAIQRLERDGLIDGEWKPTENNRRARYYTLTAKGRKRDRKSTRLNSSHGYISYAVFCLKKKKNKQAPQPTTTQNSTHTHAYV